MILGLDIHGVIDIYPEKMMKLAQLTRENGGKVFVITGPSIDKARKELDILMATHGISEPFYDQIYSIVDYIKGSGVAYHEDDKGHVWALKNEDWNSVKGKLAVDLKLDLHIDDTEEYGEYFPPGVFLHLKNKGKKDVTANIHVP